MKGQRSLEQVEILLTMFRYARRDMGVARIFFGGGTLFQKNFQKLFQKILKKFSKKFKKFQKFQKIFKNFQNIFKKIFKNFQKKFQKNCGKF